MGGLTNSRHIQDIAVGITGRFKVEINLAPALETLRVLAARALQRLLEGLDVVAIEELHGAIEVAGVAEPVVQQLKGAAGDVQRDENDVLIPYEMTQGRIISV